MALTRRDSSSSWALAASEGASVSRQAALWVLGKAITSRIELLAAEQHHQAVEAEGDAAVGRCAGLQGREQEAELFLVLRGLHAEGVKHLLLEVALVDADAAAADLQAVEHQVVGPRPYGQGLCLQLVVVVLQGRGEGVVQGLVAFFGFVILQQGEMR